jgi:hypothetical protein
VGKTDDDYLDGLRRELAGARGEKRDAVLAEIKRVGGAVPDASPRPRSSGGMTEVPRRPVRIRDDPQA